MAINNEYESLLSSDMAPDQNEDELKSRLLQSSFLQVIRISTTVIAFCSIIDIGLVLYLVFFVSARTSSAHVVPGNIDKLPVVSTYVDFDGLYRTRHPSTKYLPIINRARNFIHVSSELSNQHTVFPIWPISRASIDGTIPVLENRLLVTDEISTIVQFRIVDYGMENCTLVLHFPTQTSNFSSITVSNKEAHSPKIQVWKLATEGRLNTKNVSWSTKPHRIEHLGIFMASRGQKMELSAFTCRSGSYQTFEISCADSIACEIDATTKGISNDPLFYIRQSQSI